jgi:hypothetical protein
MPERKPRRRLTAIAILVALAGAYLCLAFGWTDVVTRPWAKSITGAPVLMDRWTGELPVPGAAPRPILLELQRIPETVGKGSCAHCARIEGTAKVCVPGIGVETFTIRGDVNNWRGTVFRLNAAAPQRSPGTYTNLGELKGEWDGADLIRLRVTPHPVVINADGSSTVSSSDSRPDVEVNFELHRARSGQPQCR